MTTTDKETITRLEEVAANAWPASSRIILDGWQAGLSGPLSRRANSVLPLYSGAAPLEDKIELCRSLYHDHGRTSVFKMTPAAQPSGLDEALVAAGYYRASGALVQTLAVVDRPRIRLDLDFQLLARPTDDWLAACGELAGYTEAKKAALPGICRAILPPARFALLTLEGRPAACGLVVAERGLVGLFDLCVDPIHRRRGVATAMIASLIDWAITEHQAVTAYLQVEPDNQPALAMYAKLGFAEAYTYWYRQLEPEG